MKKIIFIILNLFFINILLGQKVVLQGKDNYLINSIKDKLSKTGLSIERKYDSDWRLDEYEEYPIQSISKVNKKLKKSSNFYEELGVSFILLPIKQIDEPYICCIYKDNQYFLKDYDIWWSEYLVYNTNNNKSKVVRLTISTSGIVNPTLESSSNIVSFTQEVNDFIQSFNSSNKSLAIQNYSNKADINITKNIFISKPSLMVIPNKINPAKLINGEYQLTKNEKMLIAAFKNKFEDNHYTTFGFESVLKRIYENRLINDNIHDDIKSKILESSGIDFFVEFENLDENNTNCDKVYDFKIRNFSTGEDVASDLKNLNQCGNSETYKDFASSILNAGAVSKINNQFNLMLRNGQKVNITFTISNTSDARLNKEYNGIKLGVHINNCLQSLSFKGNLELQEESDLRKQATINIPVFEENSGQRYQTTTFAEEVISYLKKNAGVECDRVVSRQSINIKIK